MICTKGGKLELYFICTLYLSWSTCPTFPIYWGKFEQLFGEEVKALLKAPMSSLSTAQWGGAWSRSMNTAQGPNEQVNRHCPMSRCLVKKFRHCPTRWLKCPKRRWLMKKFTHCPRRWLHSALPNEEVPGYWRSGPIIARNLLLMAQ